MPSPPGPFYAFLQDESTLYLGVFPTRAYADKYWRIIQQIRGGGLCRRIHSQYYIVPVLPNKLGDNPDWNPHLCLVRQLKHDCLPVTPPDQCADNRNGASFYIRSILHPKFYWYFNPKTRQVELSKINQSRFTITRVGAPANFQTPSTGGNDDILICEDMVSLSVGYNGHRVYIVRGHEKTMIASNQQGPLQFGQFDKGFCGLYGKEEGLVYAGGNSEEVGEKWEFVA